MSGQVEINPTFINDEGVSTYGSGLKLKENENEKIKPKSYSNIEMKDIKSKAQEAGEYDPYQHRNVEHPTTNLETFLHLIKGSIGTGILSMPLAFRHSGYFVGLIGTVIIGAICANCIHLLLQASHELCIRRKVPLLTYPATAQAALEEGPAFLKKLAPYAMTTVNIFLIIYQLGAGCVYTVFIADNIKDVADQYMEPLDVKVWMVIILLPLILINYIRNLKFLAPLTSLANIITVGSFGIILYYLIRENITFENREPAGKLIDFPLFFGTVLFALEAIGVIMPLENEMKTPKSFTKPFGILNIAMFFIVTFYVGMGLLGYLTYGSDVEETITLNIGKTEMLAQTAKLLLAIAIFITHPLQMYVGIDIVWNEYIVPKIKDSLYLTFWEYVVRTTLVLITFGLSIAIPRLGLFISLFGALSLSTLGLAFPALINMSTFWYNLSGIKSLLTKIKCWFLIVFGIIGFVVGTWISMKNIIESF